MKWRIERDVLFHHDMFRRITLVCDDLGASLTTDYQSADGLVRALVRNVPVRLKSKWYGLDGRAHRMYESIGFG